jgi:hypothetical protein
MDALNLNYPFKPIYTDFIALKERFFALVYDIAAIQKTRRRKSKILSFFMIRVDSSLIL